MSFVELKNVYKQYANTNKNAVTDFNLKIEEKEREICSSAEKE